MLYTIPSSLTVTSQSPLSSPSLVMRRQPVVEAMLLALGIIIHCIGQKCKGRPTQASHGSAHGRFGVRCTFSDHQPSPIHESNQRRVISKKHTLLK